MKDTTVKPNREQRRHPEKFQAPQDEPLSRSTEILDSGHGKKTADTSKH